MMNADKISKIIASDFIAPTIERLSKQLGKNIELKLKVALDSDMVESEILSLPKIGLERIFGEARVLVSNTAIAGRYKYHLQCIFPERSDLEGFSGIRLNGALMIEGDREQNDYSGFMYTYNEWDWGAKVRGF